MFVIYCFISFPFSIGPDLPKIRIRGVWNLGFFVCEMFAAVGLHETSAHVLMYKHLALK